MRRDKLIVSLPEGGVAMPLSRRELLGALGVGIAGGALHARFETALDDISIDAHTLRTFEDAYDSYQLAARSMSPTALIDGLIGDVAVLDGLRRRAGRNLKVQFDRLKARYAESLSWLSEEAGDVSGALYWIDRASQWAHATGWSSMAAYGFVRRSMMAVSFTSDGHRAVDNARTVLELSDASPRMQGLAAKQMAFGYALTGDERSSFRALDEAMGLLSASVREDDAPLGQRSVVSDDLLAIFRATCDVYLGRSEPAVRTLTPRLSSLSASSTRTATITRAKLSRAYANAGQPKEAATLALHALNDIDRIQSLSARSELARSVPVLRRWQRRADVREVLARLAPTTV